MANTLPSRVPCTYSGCQRLFNSEKDMKKHKVSDPAHEYCGRCDQDFQTEEHLLIHKIKSEKHMVCPICGTEFRSESGRDSHIRQNHRASQNITCHGCPLKFKSASGLMRHIEDDECPGISQTRLFQEQTKKLMIKEALEYGEVPGLIEEVDPVDGGVKVSSAEEANREAMAHQPGQTDSDLTSSIARSMADKHWPFIGGNENKLPEPAMSDLMAFSEASVATKDQESGGWKGKGKSPSVVGSGLSYVPPFGIDTLDAGQTLRTLDRSWDPTRFFNSFTGVYVCPCKQEFQTSAEFESHVLSKSKANRKVQCPGCLRIFKSTAALIAHCESPTTRCDINEGNKYAQIIDELTGGVIQTAGYNEDGTMKYEAGKLDITKTTTVGVNLRNEGW